MFTSRLLRTLSAAFNRSAQTRASIPSRNAQSQVVQRLSPTSRTHQLSLLSQNVDAFSTRPVSRANHILNHILDAPKPPDIIFLQEVTLAVRASLLANLRVRGAFLVRGVEDQTAWEGVPFATMTLLSNARFASDLDSQNEGDEIERGGEFMLGSVTRVTLPSKYRRDGLYVDIIPPTAPGTVFRLVNVHLDSLWDTLPYRAQQLKILASMLRKPGCAGGVIAGDFNAISPQDDGLVEENDLVDAWVALHGAGGGERATWGVGVERRDGFGPKRLDKVTVTRGVKAEEIEVIRPGRIEVPRPGVESLEIPWSDHCGLRCTFTFMI